MLKQFGKSGPPFLTHYVRAMDRRRRPIDVGTRDRTVYDRIVSLLRGDRFTDRSAGRSAELGDMPASRVVPLHLPRGKWSGARRAFWRPWPVREGYFVHIT